MRFLKTNNSEKIMILIIGAFLGLFSVGFGAYSEHGLKPIISDEEFRFLMTAIRYNQVNAAVIVAIGFVLTSSHSICKLRAFQWSAKIFVAGTFLFAFSIYLSILLGIKELTYITPVGGITLMVAWSLLLISGVQLNRKS